MTKQVNLNTIHARGKTSELLAALSGGLGFKKTIWKILPILFIIILTWKVKVRSMKSEKQNFSKLNSKRHSIMLPKFLHNRFTEYCNYFSPTTYDWHCENFLNLILDPCKGWCWFRCIEKQYQTERVLPSSQRMRVLGKKVAAITSKGFWSVEKFICATLRNLVPLVQFWKCEKTTMEEYYFS